MWKGTLYILFALSINTIVHGGSSHSSMSGSSRNMEKERSSSHATHVKVVDKQSSYSQTGRARSSSSDYYDRQGSTHSGSADAGTAFESQSGGAHESKNGAASLTDNSYPNGVSVATARDQIMSRSRLDASRRSTNEELSAPRQAEPSLPVNRRVIRPLTRRECTDCVLNGASYKGHSRFEYQEDCLHHRCICHCDGSADCPEESVTDMCERENMNNPNCQTCSVQDREIKGNSYFDMTEECTLYKNCICRCNGSWECSDDRSENICAAMRTTEAPYVSECRSCFAYGALRSGNSRFTHNDDCFEYDCDCFCDGRFECPTERAQNICDYDDESPPDCSECEVNGEFFEGNSKFKRSVGCVEYTCDCNCDGSFDCPEEYDKDNCPISTPLPEIVPETCSDCDVSETEFYPGGSNFTIRKECIHYDCKCNCDGSWSCPGKDARNLCKGERPGGCVNCEVSETEFHRGDTNFTMTKGCIGYSCVCNCDGSWNCPGEDARDTCKGEIVGGCKNCALSDKEYYPGNTDFEMKQGCILYQCRCKCNGGWDCPGFKAKDICQDPESDTLGRREECTTCEMSNGEKHQPNTRFSLERGCYEYQCTCNCNGAYECPPESATNICDVSPDREAEFKAKQEDAYRRQRLREREIMLEQQRRLAYERQGSRVDNIRAAHSRQNSGTNEGEQIQRAQQERLQIERSQKERLQIERAQQERLQRERLQRGRQTERQIERQQSETQQERIQRVREQERRRQEILQQERLQQERLQRETAQERLQNATQQERIQRATEQERLRQNTLQQERLRAGRGRAQQIQARLERMRVLERAQEERLKDERLAKLTRAEQTASEQVRTERTRFQQTQTGKISSGRIPNIDPYNSQACLKCSFAGKTHDGNTQFEYKRGCFVYQCTCDCNGRWHCDRTTVKNTCNTSPDQNSKRPATGTQNTQYQQSVSTQGRNTGTATHTAQTNSRDLTSDKFYQTANGYQVASRRYPQYPISRSTDTDSGNSLSQGRGSGYSYQTSSSSSSNSYPVASSKQTYNVQTSKRVIFPSSATGFQQVPASGNYGNPFLRPAVRYPSSQSTGYRVAIPGGLIYPSSQQASSSVHTSSKHVYPVAHRFGSRQTSTSYTSPVHRTPSLPVASATYPAAVDSSVNTDACQTCLADGKNYDVNDYFDMNRNCVTYKCRCMCNGNYRCAITPNPTCNDGTVKGQCGNCHVNGLIFPGNMGFQQRKGCFERTCQCNCNGTYDCPPEKKVSLCPSNEPALTDLDRAQSDCGTCEIEGHSYTGNSNFKIYQKCFVYTCTCDCTGKWECSAEHAPGCVSADSAVTVGYPNFNTTGICSKCRVADHSYSPDTNFTLKQGCLSYGCRCNCDGTWFCPSQNPKQVCNAKELQKQAVTCRPCDVRGTVYPADATFVLREGCHQHTCTCNCDGTWRCPIKSTINVCKESTKLSDASVTCKPCVVSGKSYVANTDFKFREGCTQYSCQCFCNSSFECPADKAENMCRSADYRIDGCRECSFKNQTYPGGSRFNYREGCWEFNCMCSCDGKMTCPPDRSVDVCRTAGAVSSRCRPCIIDTKVVKSESSFNIRHGCKEYLCDCKCNGNWTCPPERSINNCQLDAAAGDMSSKSASKDSQTNTKGCTVGNKTYYTRLFGYTEHCIQYTCICFDNGAWRCPPNKSKRVC